MPVTFPAHQGLIIGAKLRWPGRVDGTALCIAAAAPDLSYPLGPFLNGIGHTFVGVVVWSMPVAIAAAVLVRWRAARGVFAHLPDLGPLRLRSYRVLGERRPPLTVTVISAAVGGASHVVIDAFTHQGRWGADLLHLNAEVVTLPVRGTFTGARLLQYLGHTGGSALFVAALVFIASRGRLEAWYGHQQVAEARRVQVSIRERVVFVTLLCALPAAAMVLAPVLNRGRLFLPIVGLFLGFLLAGVACADHGSTRCVGRSVNRARDAGTIGTAG